MFIKKNVKDIMIPIENYTFTSDEKSLHEAIMNMRKVYCEVETGKCTEAGHRTSLVINRYGNLSGIIDFPTIFRALVPDISERFTEKLTSRINDVFIDSVLKKAEVKVSNIMIKIRGSLKVDDNLLEALKVMHRKKVIVLPVYEGAKLVGVLRDSDLFLAVASVFTD